MWARVAIALLIGCGSKQTARPGPTCAKLGDHVLSLFVTKDERTREIREVFATRCEQDKWTPESRDCVLGTKSLKDPQGCKAKLTPEQRGALDANLALVEEKAAERPPSECIAYEEMIVKVATCSQLPQVARDSLKQTFESSKASWKANKNRASLAASCKAGADGTRQAVSSICKW